MTRILGDRACYAASVIWFLLGCAVPLQAQVVIAKSGAWGEFNLSAGALVMSCNGCAEDGTYVVPTGGVAAGAVVSHQLLMGGRISGWKRGGSDDGAIRLAATARWYPSAGSSLFLVGDVGYVTFRGVRAGGATETGSGVTFGAGAGWDLPIGGNTALTPTFSVSYDAVGGTDLIGTQLRSGLGTLLIAAGLTLSVF